MKGSRKDANKHERASLRRSHAARRVTGPVGDVAADTVIGGG